MKAIIQLPVHHPPEWIATEINLLDAKNLVIFDDDESVHQAVKIRVLSNAQLSHLRLISCCNERHFEDFLASEDFESTLFLIDYEFRGNSKTGIDYINRFRINRYSILVTSHWDEQKVINESKLAHVPIFPKGLMDSVRFITEPKQEVDFVLIDDNPIVRFAWKTAANSYGLNYRMFSNPAYFQMHCRGLSVHSKIFIDFHFSDTTGLQLLQELEGEFYNYFMLTGEDQENIPNSIFLDRKRIIFSKQFPGHLFVKKANSSELGKAT